MITFTQMKEQAAANCGVYTSDTVTMAKIVRDLNTGVKLFQNAARRYWTRNEKKTNLTADQQYYQFSSDMLRLSYVKVLRGNRYYPLKQIRSEDEWNKINVMPYFRSNAPIYYFIKGADEIGLYPIPNSNVVDGLIVSYEPRMVDMAIEDVTISADLVNESIIITAVSPATFSQKLVNNCWLTATNGSDGNWYKISKYIDSTHIWVDNNYQGPTENGVSILIGQCPPFPEEYHDAPVYYASQQFFLLRKDLESASMYGQLFDKLFNEYKQIYGNKTTGGVINPQVNSIDPMMIDPFLGYTMK